MSTCCADGDILPTICTVLKMLELPNSSTVELGRNKLDAIVIMLLRLAMSPDDLARTAKGAAATKTICRNPLKKSILRERKHEARVAIWNAVQRCGALALGHELEAVRAMLVGNDTHPRRRTSEWWSATDAACNSVTVQASKLASKPISRNPTGAPKKPVKTAKIGGLKKKQQMPTMQETENTRKVSFLHWYRFTLGQLCSPSSVQYSLERVRWH